MRPTTTDRRTQEDLILWTLQAAWPNEVPAPALSQISLQYSRAIHSLRHKRGWLIVNRVETIGGKRRGFFKLGTAPVPSGKELRERRPTAFGDGERAAARKQEQADSLFPDMRERHVDLG